MKLKPCPFCGGELQTLGENHYYAHLTNGCILQHLCFEVDDEETIEAWNRLEPMDKIVEQLGKHSFEASNAIDYIETLVAMEIVKSGGAE